MVAALKPRRSNSARNLPPSGAAGSMAMGTNQGAT